MPAGNSGSLAIYDPTMVLEGQSPKMKQVAHIVERIAQTDIPVLICGESGTGKDLVARLIHLKSSRQFKPFLKVNCAAIPRDLLESELFGFERGSFTGAYQSKPGKFALAHKGTIFLDEISAMLMSVQPKLLQVLQDRQFSRLGAKGEIEVDVRFISSSNGKLETLVSEGRFREDLYYRLNVVTVCLPPLRERKEDIPELARYLFHRHALAFQRDGLELSDELIDRFLGHDWPGNVRELENVIRKLLATGDESTLLENATWEHEDETEDLTSGEEESPLILPLKKAARQAARQAEREMLLLALQKTKWNRRHAAELLQISYKAMLYKLKEAGLSKQSRTAYSG